MNEPPYRVQAEKPVEPKKPFLCRIGLHKRIMVGVTVSGRVVEQCKRCGEQTTMTFM